MIRKVFVLFSLFCGFASQGCPASEIVVKLQTEMQATPLMIKPFADVHSGLGQEYLTELFETLRFDMDVSGPFCVVDFEKGAAPYTIEITVKEGKKLFARVLSHIDKEEIQFKKVPLSGELNRDRKEMHRLADSIVYELSGIDGIATSKILYTVRTVQNGVEKSSVWEADYDGGGARVVAGTSGYCVTPAYVPMRPGYIPSQFLFVAYTTGQPKIYLSSLKADAPKRLLSLPGNQLMPTVSKQGDRIAFISDASGNPDLFIQDFDPESGVLGKPRHLFTAPLAVQGTPSFSPDGKRLAFVSNKGGTPRIYVLEIPPPGTPLKNMRPELISKINRENTAPAWSPDGAKIAYCARTGGERQIWVYDFATNKERRLTEGPGNKENPSWAPDSNHLIFNTSDAGACELYIVILNKGKAVKLAAGPGEKRFPSWEPRA